MGRISHRGYRHKIISLGPLRILLVVGLASSICDNNGTLMAANSFEALIDQWDRGGADQWPSSACIFRPAPSTLPANHLFRTTHRSAHQRANGGRCP
ncbi:hypothetical protein RPD_2172 [Rhodopseudomonas palustris BisB5]|uniref:Uncharacterized protein n=1 Tax=Rhodopseudomonas palustris (strain BisB5) TaxID=316057 RepID=Q138T2_RHOPS|nr:hypothetical protein RPD_2172 [Rhodopseudomonas palustris BisB5]